MADLVECKICGGWYSLLTTHIRVHSITYYDYLARFPGSEVMSDSVREAKVEGINKYFGALSESDSLEISINKSNAQALVSSQKSESLKKVWGNYTEEAKEARIKLSANGIILASDRKSESMKANWEGLSEESRRVRLDPMHLGNKAKWDESSEIEKDEWLNKSFQSFESMDKRLSKSEDEARLEIFLNLHFLDRWVYNGDGSQRVRVGRRIPDFIRRDGSKYIIEEMSPVWHSKGHEIECIMDYGKLGYKCLVIWSYELDDSDLFDRVSKFEGGG